ncbi:DUF2937 family protein [Pseudoalteromonas fenneropenaei]|uniref:DUF2937 family protein n=1 Tax=Pseudoalteromonas fenneropenaei TaxID=1737459 RepID=A0ABV7CN49_9GAMM
MRKLFDYLKLAVLITAILIGVQIPGFVTQYGNNLAARMQESQLAITAFQHDADKYFHGDIKHLIAHYAKQNDPVIVSAGENIAALFARNQRLSAALQEFQRAAYSPYLHVMFNPIAEIRQDVWRNYNYQVLLNASAIAIGVGFGLVVLAGFELLLSLLWLICKGIFRPKSIGASS